MSFSVNDSTSWVMVSNSRVWWATCQQSKPRWKVNTVSADFSMVTAQRPKNEMAKHSHQHIAMWAYCFRTKHKHEKLSRTLKQILTASCLQQNTCRLQKNCHIQILSVIYLRYHHISVSVYAAYRSRFLMEQHNKHRQKKLSHPDTVSYLQQNTCEWLLKVMKTRLWVLPF